jgi:hypothetical protein
VRYRGIANGWRAGEMIERGDVRTDDPVQIGEMQADLERIAELRNQAAWALKEVILATSVALARESPALEAPPRLVYTIGSGVRSGGRGDRVEMGVQVWRFTGWLDGWQRVAILHGVSVRADDPIALGEARAELEAPADRKNQERENTSELRLRRPNERARTRRSSPD